MEGRALRWMGIFLNTSILSAEGVMRSSFWAKVVACVMNKSTVYASLQSPFVPICGCF